MYCNYCRAILDNIALEYFTAVNKAEYHPTADLGETCYNSNALHALEYVTSYNCLKSNSLPNS